MSPGGAGLPKTVLVVDDSVQGDAAPPAQRDRGRRSRSARRRRRRERPRRASKGARAQARRRAARHRDARALGARHAAEASGCAARRRSSSSRTSGTRGRRERAEAFRLGAADVIDKPSGSVSMDMRSARGTILNQTLRRVLRAPPRRRRAKEALPPPAGEAGAGPQPSDLGGARPTSSTPSTPGARLRPPRAPSRTPTRRPSVPSRRPCAPASSAGVDDVFTGELRALGADVREAITTNRPRRPVLVPDPLPRRPRRRLVSILPLPGADGSPSGAFCAPRRRPEGAPGEAAREPAEPARLQARRRERRRAPLERVLGVVEGSVVTPLPYSAPPSRGSVEAFGQIMPQVSLAKLLSLRSTEGGILVIVSDRGGSLALRVVQVTGMIQVEDEVIAPCCARALQELPLHRGGRAAGRP